MFKIALACLFVAAASASAGDHDGKSGPCATLKASCEKAGFKMGGHKEGKGVIVDCMGKVAKGETVAGVDFSTTDPANQACVAHLASKKEHMMEKRAAKKAAKGTPPESAQPTETPTH